MDRRTFIKVGASLPLMASANTARSILTRTIPSSGETLPVIGVGTSRTFDVGDDAAKQAQLRQVLQEMKKYGATVIDSSPMYGSAERVVGQISSAKDNFFMATKVWAEGREVGIREMRRSFQLMGVKQMDLMQVHNLLDTDVHMPVLAEYKQAGLIRYIGITHYLDSAHQALMQAMKKYPIDFVQINYSLAERAAEDRLLPLAREQGIATLINRPFGRGRLFRSVKGHSFPDWAKEFDSHSWAQFFLKFILSNNAVSCVIPGTSKPEHMRDNINAGIGRLPDQAERRKIIDFWHSIA